MKLRATASLTLMLAISGCASINDCCYEHTQQSRAVIQYKSCGHPECSAYPHDYKEGWLDGFYEVATGGSCCPPAIAPAKYWKPRQVLKNCDNRRHAYYSGWQDGAANASRFPDTHYLRIYETCECPFPRCENPCGDGSCVPCGTPMSVTPMPIEMIDMQYQPEMISEPATDAPATDAVPSDLPEDLPAAKALSEEARSNPNTWLKSNELNFVGSGRVNKSSSPVLSPVELIQISRLSSPQPTGGVVRMLESDSNLIESNGSKPKAVVVEVPQRAFQMIDSDY